MLGLGLWEMSGPLENPESTSEKSLVKEAWVLEGDTDYKVAPLGQRGGVSLTQV